METKKLYYDDSGLGEFTARVLCCRQTDKGWAVTLDRTAFYPTGGGQACDTGILGGAKVLEVLEEHDEVIHYCDAPLQEGAVVEGVIDWDRRLDLMQQHTGEHILSGLIFERYGYHNVGFHVGAVAMEVDFDGLIPAEELQQLEQQANRIVWQNLALKCFTPDPQELEKTIYRTKRALPWPVRIVQVPGVDSCACCGVHVKFTGQVGLIKILSAAKFHGGIRLQMVCGNRAYDYMNRIFEENRGISQLLSAQMTQTLDAVKQLQQTCESTKYKLVQMQDQHLRQVAESVKGMHYPVVFEPDLTGGQLRDLTEMMAQNSIMAVACTGADDTGYQICLVGRGAVETGTQAMKCLSGRGGGKNGAFQGKVQSARAQIEEFFQSKGKL